MKIKIRRILLFVLPLVLAAMIPLVTASDGFGGVLNAYIKFIDDKSMTVVDLADLDKNLIKGALSGTDRYSYYQEMTTYESQVDEYQDANFVGIGVTIVLDEKGALVTSVFMNSPAYRGGIKSGDIIISADGIDLGGKSLNEIASLIKGPVNSKVEVGFLVKGAGEPLVKVLDREKVEIKTVAYTIYGEAAYIRITGFTDKTGEEFRDTLEKIGKAGTDKLILDLRDNGGGTVRGCIETARQILSDETIVKMDFRYNGYLDIRYTAPENSVDYEIVVIVNENTASAGEILSAAIQDNEKGILVGENTFGKSLVQSSYLVLTEEAYEKYSAATGETKMYVVARTLPRIGITPEDDEWLGAVKLSIGEYLTPNGKSINNVGIRPDVLLEYDGPIAFEEILEGELFIYAKYDIGMSSEQVAKAKKILSALGYDTGGISGYYDEAVFKAVMQFQRDEGLYPYGVLDYTTQGALNNRLKLLNADRDAQFQLAYNELTEGGR
ncbi:MAG: S41 family peptidase [Clostridia bacterium]|nr:S41 family peptidase [Clostridia bacterium]